MGEDLERLRQEYEDAKAKAAQYKNQVTRLQNRLSYKENRTRKERAHRLITLVRMVRENSVTVQNVRLEMSRRLHGATDVTPETISNCADGQTPG